MFDALATASLIAALDSATARIVLECLSATRDQFSYARLAQAGISAGWRCLVVNAGIGKVARWLADAVAPDGAVVATTSTPEHVQRHEAVTVLTQGPDIRGLADDPFELVHARLPLGDLPTQAKVVDALIDLLRPGGTLVVEVCHPDPGVLLSPRDTAAAELYRRYQTALQEALVTERNSATSAVDLPDIFVRAGLVGVDVALHARSWAGGTPGTTLHIVLAAALHDRLVAADMDADELCRLRQFLADPQVLVLSRPVLSIIGRRWRSSVC